MNRNNDYKWLGFSSYLGWIVLAFFASFLFTGGAIFALFLVGFTIYGLYKEAQVLDKIEKDSKKYKRNTR